MSYSNEELLEALRAYPGSHGGIQPSWERWKQEGLRPSVQTYGSRFGSWADALVEAGFEAFAPGGYAYMKEDETAAAILRHEAGESLARIGADLGVTGQALGRRIRRYERRALAGD